MFKSLITLYKRHFNLVATLRLNFKAFSFSDAIKLPVYVYGRIDMEDIHRGCIKLKDVRRKTLRIGGWKTELWGTSNLFKSYFRCAGTLYCEGKATIDQGCKISICEGARLNLGYGIVLNRNVLIHVKDSVSIGSDVRIGWDCQIYDSNFHYTVHQGKIRPRNAAVEIGHHVWLANSVTVSKGVVLPPYSVVAARSLLNKDYSAYGEKCLFGGVPAKMISTDIRRLYRVENALDQLIGDREYITEDEAQPIIKGQ